MLFNFDYDGVIVDSFNQLLDLLVQAQNWLGRGRAPTARDLRTIENLTFEDLGRLIGLPESDIPSFCKRTFDLQKRKWEVEVFHGIVDVFHQIARNHTIVVITSSQSDAVAASLQRSGLAGIVAKVMGGELNLTKAERIEQAQRIFSFEKRETYMVGDAVSDIRQGKLAGVRTVAVAWGYQNRDLLWKEQPDFFIDSPKELLEITHVGKPHP